MIITEEVYKALPNRKKWVQGRINLRSDVVKQLGKKDKTVTLIILEGEDIDNLDDEKFKEMMQKLSEARAINKEMQKLKREMFIPETPPVHSDISKITTT